MNMPLWWSLEDATIGQRAPTLPKTPDAIKERERELALIEKEISQSRRAWQRMYINDPKQRLSDAVRLREHQRNIAKTMQLRETLSVEKALRVSEPVQRITINVDAQYLPIVHTVDTVKEKLALLKAKKGNND